MAVKLNSILILVVEIKLQGSNMALIATEHCAKYRFGPGFPKADHKSSIQVIKLRLSPGKKPTKHPISARYSTIIDLGFLYAIN